MKTYADINNRIEAGKAVVLTADEIIDYVDKKGIEAATKEVDVVTTATFGAMCSSGCFLNFGHSKPKIRMSEAWIEDVLVSPLTPRDNTNRLVSAGVLDAGGFTSAVLSVGGDVKGTVPAAAELGAVLVPDEVFVEDAFTRGYILFPIEVAAQVPANSAPSVGSDPKRFDLAFPRYRVYLFNTSSRAINAQVYVLLTH